MVTATEFVDFDLRQGDSERQRLTRLISDLPKLPQVIRAKLAEEFLKIIADPDEAFGRKVQAASMLAYQAHRLGIRGSAPIARDVCAVLEKEFVLTVKHPFQSSQGVGVPTKKLTGSERLLIGKLIAAALFIDYSTGAPVVKKFIESLTDEDASTRFTEIMEAAKRT